MVSNPWFPYVHPRPEAKVRLFCFSHSGGVASLFRNWHEYLPEFFEVYPVQLPGRETRISEPLISSMEELIAALFPQLSPFLDRPSLFFGHSLGALVAFELVKNIQNKIPHAKTGLFVSACSAPHRLQHVVPLHNLPDKELIGHLQRYGATPKALLNNPEAMQFLLPRLRADFKIFETYSAQSILVKDRMVAFGGKEDELVGEENLEAWKSYSQGFFKMHLFPGGHFYYATTGVHVCKIMREYSAEWFNF